MKNKMKKTEIAGSPLNYPITFEDLKSGRVKLEFGNPLHIKIIDEEAERLKELEETRGTYRVTFAVSGEAIVEVEADNEDEAEELARDEIFLNNYDDLELDYDFLESEKID